ncbi:MAG: hypothetical protein QM535_07090 [Limnohabitans sp.]|nr:hypothetical protein [Limnohabitans sp.]
MKKYNFLLLLSAFFFLFSCQKEEFTDPLTGEAKTGGLATINNALVPYVVGNGNTFAYKAGFAVYQAKVQTTSMEIYKSFTRSSDGKTSNEILLKSIPLAAVPGSNEVKSFNFTYDELIAGLKINGVNLPTVDTNLNIGDYWTLKYVAKTSEGNLHLNVGTTKVAVGTRLAGTYKCIEGLYMRNSVQLAATANWPAETVIESVNTTTYRIVKRFGYFPAGATDDNTWYFNVVGTTISYPATEPDGSTANTGNDLPVITCGVAPPASFLPQFNCGDTNKVILDNVNGKDRLIMTFGYYNPGGSVPGTRQFYQVLEKI